MSLSVESEKDRRAIARKRWIILGQVLRGNSYSNVADSSVSVRRFQSYGLLTTEQCQSPSSNDDDNDGVTWFTYKCKDIPGFSMTVSHLGGTLSKERLLGFNNTGNVCVWPSEEVMTYYCMQHVQEFKHQRVCELGGGMTCLAGVALAIHSEAEYIELTDGNEESVSNLHSVIANNEFRGTNVSARLLRWGKDKPDESLCNAFDTVICADCLFFDDGREDLANLIFNMLKPGGKALLFAPSRNKTFDKFEDLASNLFIVEVEDQYDNYVYSLHCKLKKEMAATYDESLHFPKLMTLVKKNPQSREITPETR